MKTSRFLAMMLCMLFCSVILNAQKPPVEGTWKIKSLKDSGKMTDVGAKETTVEIDTKAKSILLYVGCNRITSKLEFVTGDMIKPMALTSSRKSCKDYIDGLENAARYAMEQTNSIRKNGAKIEFYKDNDLLMVLERPVDNGKKKR